MLFCLRRRVKPLPPVEPRTLVRTGARCDARRFAFACALCALRADFYFLQAAFYMLQKLRFTCCMAAWCTPTAGVRPPSEFTRARAHMRAGAHAWQECMRCAAAPWQRYFAATHDETLPRYHSSSPRRDRTRGAPLPRYHSTAPGVPCATLSLPPAASSTLPVYHRVSQLKSNLTKFQY